MSEILKIVQQTSQKFLNLFEFTVKDKTGNIHPYYVASRAETKDDLKVCTQNNKADGVIIYGILPGVQERIVLIQQYRYAIGDYIYELPAGLVEPTEDFRDAAIREMKEETGLDLIPGNFLEAYSRPFFTSVGMTDESCRTVYGWVQGVPSLEGLEDSEEITVCLADRKMAEKILKEEKVSIMAGYLLMHFIHNKDPFGFLKQKESE